MKEKMICFSRGLSDEDIENGKTSFYRDNRENPALEVIAVTESILDEKVGKILERLITDSEIISRELPHDSKIQSSSGSCKYRLVIVNTSERPQVLQVMRSFKAVLPDPQNIIFAVITEAARTWTFAEYIEHLCAEHEYMKTRKPEDNPDMKKL